ncbi:hypothetical protein ACFO25_17135 [Paenactinomyces guangxiensis]|uniref:Phospholipid phosphatase n=1 Tax=Paenactinomyces guangxiensis TaxID=1490290 RepID=A0A7W1WUF8_9BACL|nr:hypothetical protein [Paenactinomyces guangxiensis]MBA4496198.1 hypothetical protein [Paenactinomyces guangxiensis]MBH8593287.1 hypothetical protein [Paenactinomyces guangxiensis]
MDAFLYPLITFLYLILSVWSFRFFRESSFWGTSWIFFIIVGLIYNNLVLSLGRWMGEGEVLEVMSLFRYLLHVLLTPTLVFVALDILRRINVEWSEYLSTHIIYNLYTFSLTVIGVFTEIVWINLEPVTQSGVVRYASVDADSYLSYSTLLTLIPLFISAVMVWRQLRWPVLLLGVVVATAGGILAVSLESFVIGSAFELILMASLVLTEQKLKQEDFHTPETLAG